MSSSSSLIQLLCPSLATPGAVDAAARFAQGADAPLIAARVIAFSKAVVSLWEGYASMPHRSRHLAIEEL